MHRRIMASVFVWILVILVAGCSRKSPTNQAKGETAPSDTTNAAAAPEPGMRPDASAPALQSSERYDAAQPLQTWELTNACGVQPGMTQAEVEELVGTLTPGDTGNRLYDEQRLSYRFWDRSGGEPKLMEMEWNAAVENDEIVFETAQDAPAFRGICLGDPIDAVLEKFPCADRELKNQQSQIVYGQEGDADCASLHLIADSYYSLSFYVEGQWRASIDFSRVQQRVFRIVIYGDGYWQPESQQETQTELSAPAARTWQDIRTLLPDVSAMSGFPTAEEAWHPEPIVVQYEGAEYWIDQSESWESSKICMRKDGQTTCLYAAQDGSLSQLAAFDGMLYFAQTGGIYRMPMEGGAAERWIPDGGRFVLTGGVIYTWLPEQKFCAIAAQDPKQAVPVWEPTQALACERSVPVTGGIVLWLTENGADAACGQLWVVLLRNCGQWELLHEEAAPMPQIIFSDASNVWFMRETSDGQFLYQINCESGEYTCLGKLPEAPDGCCGPGTPVLGFQRVLMRYQGMESTMEFYALDDELNLGEHLLSYGADDLHAIYFLHLFELQETPQGFYFRGKSEETGRYLVSEIRKRKDGLLREEVLR